MNISECVEYLNFWINKKTASYLTIQECVNAIDAGQLALYSDLKPQYATSQLVKDKLAVFRATYDFTPADMISGYIIVPSNSNYLDLLDIQITFPISNFTFYYPVELINEDERANRLNSQIDPVTITSPVGEQTAPRYFRLYPLSGYTGTVTYFRRPVKPVFSYSLVSQRIVVYDPSTSVQLEWRTTEEIPVLLKALESCGINLSAAEIDAFATQHTQMNFQGINKL